LLTFKIKLFKCFSLQGVKQAISHSANYFKKLFFSF
jgi:hypothetical protein